MNIFCFNLNKKKHLKIYTFFLALFIYLIIFSTEYSKAKNYIVKNVEIIEPYSINFNKNKMIDKAFRSAFDVLIAKIVISDDLNEVKNVNTMLIKSMVDSFIITDEQFIENNYLAKINVSFEKKKVLDFLYKKNITPAIPLDKKIIFLPIFINLNSNDLSIYLNNEFYSSWNKYLGQSELLTYILPSEDLEDYSIIKKNLENIENYNFANLLSKYNKDFIVAIFFYDNNSFNVLSKINFNDELTISNSEFKDANPENNEKILDIIKELKNTYENFWKKENLVNISIKLPLTVLIDSKNLKLLKRFEKELNSSDLVYNYYVESITNNETIYKIIYNSTPKKFIKNFEDRNFQIDYNNEIWLIK